MVWRFRGVRFWFGLALAVCVAVALTVTQRSPARSEPPTARSPERIRGQWIWTARDRELFTETQQLHPELSAAILVGTVDCERGAVRLRRGLSPASTGPHPRALIVRVQDSFSPCLATDPDGVATSLDAAFVGLLSEVKDTGAAFRELQLDYDAPVSKLPRYASLLGYLRARSLRDVELWITSLPAHVEQPGYGAVMRAHVAGHILQLFDTGLLCSDARAERLRNALVVQGLPFRLGYAAFERRGAPAEASHACWAQLASAWQKDVGAAGFWVFPAGFAYDPWLSGAP